MSNELLCKQCGSKNVVKRGDRAWCKDCGYRPMLKNADEQSNYTFIDDGENSQIMASVDQEVKNADDLIRVLNIDTNIWKVDKFLISKSSAYRKDKSVEWEVEDGVVLHGKVEDSGKLLVKPLYNVKVWMSRKTEEIRQNLALEDFQTLANRFAPKAVSLKYPKMSNGMLYEIEMPDIHLGKLTWGEETGEDLDVKIQTEAAKKVIEKLLGHTQSYPVERILFPVGHDFFNVDNQFNTTSHGTPQQEDTRWRKTFKIGWTLAADMINLCSQVAPVDVYIIPGNHDEERSFYLGEVLAALYLNAKHIVVNNSPRTRKYYPYGLGLIGMTHGYHEPIKKLKDVMAYEVPDLWAQSVYREWHTGDKHHKEDYLHKTHESDNGVVIRILRSLSTIDSYHFQKGYVASLRASESFLWDKNEGVIAQFTAIPK